MNKMSAGLLGLSLLMCIGGCGIRNQNTVSNEQKSLNIAYQYGLAYTPAIVAKEKGLIEEAYKEATGKEVSVTWIQMNSGADINTGIASGDLNVGFMGAAPAITGVVKDVGYKVFTNLSGQEHSLMTNEDDVRSLKDLVGSSHQIALVNIGSIQHIILAKALSESGLDPHALDSNIVAMKHPDGMAALETGNIACHLTSSPYTYMERSSGSFYELDEVSKAWSADDSFIVGVAATSLYEEDPELYKALCDGIRTAMEYMDTHMGEVAEMTCELDGNTKEDELKYLESGSYTAETNSLFELARFMSDAGFIDTMPDSYEDLVFDNVLGD